MKYLLETIEINKIIDVDGTYAIYLLIYNLFIINKIKFIV